MNPTATAAAASDERDQIANRQRHDRVKRHAQPVRAPSGTDFYLRQTKGESRVYTYLTRARARAHVLLIRRDTVFTLPTDLRTNYASRRVFN